MPKPLIEIEERMYSVAEAAKLGDHEPEYIHALIEAGVLEGTRPQNARGRKGQWRVYPRSLRQWLGVSDPRAERRMSRQAKQEAAAAAALCGE